jgi:hypothetical protein
MDYGIHHQHMTLQWPQCNGMVEHLIQNIKHGITMLFGTPKNVECWDEQLAKIMFRYKCVIQANTKFSPFMIMIGHTPCLKVDNYLHSMIVVIDDIVDVKTTTKQNFQEMKLITNIHENVILNVEQTQKKKKMTYAIRKGKQTFEGLVVGHTLVKMKKLKKKKLLTSSWEGPH